ncbi:MAG: non-homologous end-joining DNA ligase, partial [Flavobacteriaceae bacterium]|nr:non-homologous end-joining DNA ligase [Flavobacteriaceae bacterium]
MPLEEYNKKRDFSETSEPEGKPDKSNKSRFVIQRHQASRLHYDLRLEIDNVLKSWAVPKGPSMNPKHKRLAVETEDHPVKYLTFQGDIPKGNYGAGHMDIWDNGTFKVYEENQLGNALQQYAKGNLKIELYGKKVKGKFALVKTRIEGSQQHWLLIKKEDEFSTDLKYDAEDLVERPVVSDKSVKVKKLNPKEYIKPMLATTSEKIFNDPDWIYEFKWDGYRMISHINDGKVQMYSRNGISFNSKFALIYQDLQTLVHDVILDGEVVITDKKGIAQFQKLQNYNSSTTKGRLMYYVFDILHLNGHDTIGLPLLDRKSLIPEIIQDLDYVSYCDHIEGMGNTFYKKSISLGMEGVIAKKSSSTYTPGYRSKEWLKIKEDNTTEALICGYTESDAKSKVFGSLILGQYKDDELVYIGNCGSGFGYEQQKELMQKFKPLKTKNSPFSETVNLKGRKPRWMTPSLLCEVKFTEWTKSGSLRHPVFKGLRFDKSKPDSPPTNSKSVDKGENNK